VVIPLEKAISDLHMLFESKCILNPFANQMMGRISARSMVKTIEGNAFQDVISAMRGALQIAEPMDEDNIASTSKRQRENDDDDEQRKRMRAFEL
jgi:hypothetical protein